MTQKQPGSLNHACLSNAATRIHLKNDNGTRAQTQAGGVEPVAGEWH